MVIGAVSQITTHSTLRGLIIYGGILPAPLGGTLGRRLHCRCCRNPHRAQDAKLLLHLHMEMK